jgi:ligand-binding SRPBCC domain-containing protein
MAHISKKIIINSPVRKVFEFVTTPDNWTRYVSGLTNVRDFSSGELRQGTSFRWTYRMLGINSNGTGQVLENVKNKRFAMKMEGRMPLVEKYAFAAVDKGTELSVDIEYEVPGKILKTVAKTGIVEKVNKKEADNVLGKIKLLCEEL